MTRFRIRPSGLLVALVGLMTLGGVTAHAQPDPGGDTPVTFPPPSLTSASIARASGILQVTGVDFTPGGRVEVAFADQSGTVRSETRWVTATATVYGREASADPNDPTVGFTRAGVFSALFELACGPSANVRAYDQQTARWSDWLELAPSC